MLGERTLFRGIGKLLPGHYQVIDCSRPASAEPRATGSRGFEIDRHHTEEYFVEEVQRLVGDAVRLQMRSDVPVGAYLSGGLDSSVVTLLAAQARAVRRSRPSTAPSGTGPSSMNRPMLARSPLHCGAELLEVVPTEDEFVDLMPTMLYHMDEPVAGPGLFPQYIVSRLAARHVKVCLGGQGGDEIFGGYVRYLVAYFEQAIKGAIYESNEEAEHVVTFASIVPNLHYLRQYVPMLQQFWRSGMFEDMDRRYFTLIDRSGGAISLLTSEFRAQYDSEAIFARSREYSTTLETLSYYNKMTHYDLVTGLPALLQVEDRVSMASSLESRVPLLDYRLVDLVTSMPPRLKFKGGELKFILKRAVKDLLPPAILRPQGQDGIPGPAPPLGPGTIPAVLLRYPAFSRLP